jgi:hypothetical protein
MGVEPPDAQSLPRHRKCGNCRFYEPAPLWRKGWCRNTKLYPPHANHLVEATTIDCEGGFRSQVYWEPLPESALQPEKVKQISQPIQLFNEPRRPTGQTTVVPSQEVVAPRVEVTEQHISIVPQVSSDFRSDKDWRVWVRQRVPFTAQWPLERINLTPSIVIPWAIAGLVALIALLVLTGAGRNSSSSANTAPDAALTQTAAAQATWQAAVRSITASAASIYITPTPVKPLYKQAIVKGTGSTPLNVRQEPNTKAKLVTAIRENEQVSILEGPTDSDGRGWYKIDYKGNIGWVAKDYLEVQP